jgi:hypothetical protein
MMYFLVIEFFSIWFQKEKQFCVLIECPYQLHANHWMKENTKNKTSSLGTSRCNKSKLRSFLSTAKPPCPAFPSPGPGLPMLPFPCYP